MEDQLIRVLLVDDDEDDYVMTRDLLLEIERTTFEVEWVSKYEEALQAIEKQQHDVYLVDYRLGERDGLDLLCEAIKNGCTAPIILLTGQGDPEVDVAAMKAGAADYLVKGRFEASLLERSIRYSLQQAQTLKALRQSQEQLRHDAFHDSLTDLPNRALFTDRLEHAFQRAQRRSDELFAVLFLDLDNFKTINDSLGHVIGDQVLVALAQRLIGCLRTEDTVARLGGDEFAILLEEIRDISDATRVADRIQQALRRPFSLNGQEVVTTASIGIALNATGNGHPEDFLRDADIAMYRAKALGKARYIVFGKTMHDRAMARLRLETDMRRAIEHNEFRVYYQPIVSLSTHRLAGFEALVRWQHPDHGLLPPARFMDVAEETGLIVPIDWWVMSEACHQLHGWQLRFPDDPPLMVSANLSDKQLSQPDLLDRIQVILQETKLNPGSLKLEIMESALIENTAAAKARLFELKALGIELYTDDFGTGYSSLSFLHQFPLDALKIDRTFVQQMSDQGKEWEIVRALVMLAHNLGLKVVAEGVETDGQLAQLKTLNCDYGQGYYFSEPLSAEAAEALLVSSITGEAHSNTGPSRQSSHPVATR